MTPTSKQRLKASRDEGFTLIEMMIAVFVLMIVSGTVIRGVMDMADLHATLINRSDMHSGVRNVTELLTQEIGQAGRVALPAPVTITWGTAPLATTIGVSSTAGMFVGEQLLIDTGANAETAAISAINGNLLTLATALDKSHDAGDPVDAVGGFAAGVVPSNTANGSTATRLKIFGDINSDGSMVYIEYWCDTARGRLYRNAMPFTAGAKPVETIQMVMIDNILPNPGGTPCFTYQTQTAGGATFVTDVAITLTVRTQSRDRKTGDFQNETKALLNVSPRNVFNVWQLAGLGVTNRVQPTPATVTALLQ
jgi:prepilin-type N-terminal cleavage/methylation domain-containing protein